MKKLNIKFKFQRPSKRTMIIILIVVLVIIASLFIYNFFIKGDDYVEYKILAEEQIPTELTNEILPEYKQLERALACYFNDKVYVVVTRGQKPTGGYDIGIDKMKLVEEDDGTTTLVVYVNFTDPSPGDILTQVITYPYEVAETNLKQLPDQIEMKVQYDE